MTEQPVRSVACLRPVVDDLERTRAATLLAARYRLTFQKAMRRLENFTARGWSLDEASTRAAAELEAAHV